MARRTKWETCGHRIWTWLGSTQAPSTKRHPPECAVVLRIVGVGEREGALGDRAHPDRAVADLRRRMRGERREQDDTAHAAILRRDGRAALADDERHRSGRV